MTKVQTILIERIVQLCREKGYSYYALAYKAAIPFTTLMNIINGKTKNPGIASIMKICNAFEVSLQDFFDTEEFETVLKEIDEEFLE